MNLEPYYQLVEECINDLGVKPENARGENQGQWNLTKGSAQVMIDILESKDGWGYFQCLAPICKVPEKKQTEFLLEILETAHKLYGVGFTKFRDWIYVKTIRELNDISKKEVMAMLKRIGTYADDYDDYFKNKYFGDEPREV